MAAAAIRADDSAARLPEIVVSPLREEQPVGAYEQPEWTTERRFPTTRVYLQETPGDVGVEQWVKAQWPRDEKANFLFQEEGELGLPHRFQLDVYENWARDEEGTIQQDSVSLELRYALADWGKLPLNPTLYGEWTFRNPDLGADKYEVKLLFGDEFAQRWHWGVNFAYEQETGDELTREYAASEGVSYTVLDKKLSIGEEIKVESETPKDDRHPIPLEVDVGPSVQWRPTPNTHLDVVPLIGVTSDSPLVESWIVFGVDFGGQKGGEAQAPVSLRSH